MNLVTELHAVCATLVRAQIRHAICGGVAVTIHGATRSTKDIDILIAPTDVDKAMDAVASKMPQAAPPTMMRKRLSMPSTVCIWLGL